MGYVCPCQTQFIHTFHIQHNKYIWILYQYLNEMRMYTNWGKMQIKITQGTGKITLPSSLTVAFTEQSLKMFHFLKTPEPLSSRTSLPEIMECTGLDKSYGRKCLRMSFLCFFLICLFPFNIFN